jgi:hypothetical protein
MLHITSLHHQTRTRTYNRQPLAVAMQDVYAVFTPPKGSSLVSAVQSKPGSCKSKLSNESPRLGESRILIGNSDTLARQTEMPKEPERRERNQGAYIERMERLEALQTETQSQHSCDCGACLMADKGHEWYDAGEDSDEENISHIDSEGENEEDDDSDDGDEADSNTNIGIPGSTVSKIISSVSVH